MEVIDIVIIEVSEYLMEIRNDGTDCIHYKRQPWPVQEIFNWLDNRTANAPTNACFINGKCIQMGMFSPIEITELEDSWK